MTKINEITRGDRRMIIRIIAETVNTDTKTIKNNNIFT